MVAAQSLDDRDISEFVACTQCLCSDRLLNCARGMHESDYGFDDRRVGNAPERIDANCRGSSLLAIRAADAPWHGGKARDHSDCFATVAVVGFMPLTSVTLAHNAVLAVSNGGQFSLLAAQSEGNDGVSIDHLVLLPPSLRR